MSRAFILLILAVLLALMGFVGHAVNAKPEEKGPSPEEQAKRKEMMQKAQETQMKAQQESMKQMAKMNEKRIEKLKKEGKPLDEGPIGGPNSYTGPDISGKWFHKHQ